MDYLTFNLNNTEYAIDLIKIREILTFPNNITKLPNTPKYMLGLINLRGEVVPILDLRIKFNTKNTDLYNENTTILAITTEDNRMLGLVVDNVNDTKNLDLDQRTEANEIGLGMPGKYLSGLIQFEEDMIAIVNVEKILAKEEL